MFHNTRVIRTYGAWLLGVLLSLASFASYADSNKPDGRQFLVGFAQDTLANDWRAAQVRQMEEAFSRHTNIRFIYTDGQGSTAKQIQDIEDLVHRGVDLLITSPRDARLMTPVIESIYKQGIPIVLVTRKINSDNYTTLVSPDDESIARQAAVFMANKMKGEGKVLMLRGVPTATTAIARTDGFMAEIKKHQGIQVVAVKDGNYLRSDAIRAVEEAMENKLEFNAIYSQSDSMAEGARLALKQSGVNPKDILIVGIDYISEARAAIRAGLQAASFVYPTSSQETVDAVIKILKGDKVPRRITVGSQKVTSENVEHISPIF